MPRGGSHPSRPFGQDGHGYRQPVCRAIKLDGDGRVSNFVQNEKCAGGSGKFLQVIARILHMKVEDIGALSLESANPVEFTTGCAVFRRIGSRVENRRRSESRGYPGGCSQGNIGEDRKPDCASRLVQDCVVTGGGARDIGLVRTLEVELGVSVLVRKILRSPPLSAPPSSRTNCVRLEFPFCRMGPD